MNQSKQSKQSTQLNQATQSTQSTLLNQLDQLNRSPRDAEPAVPLGLLLIGLAAVAVCTLGLAVAMPLWLPQLADSLMGEKPKAYWYLSRASAFAAFGLLWLSMVFGLLITNKLARLWPGGPTAFDLHQYVSLLGIGFIIFHVLILLGDKYINYSIAELLVPFGSANYKPAWVALGQLSFYLWLLVSLTFYIRRLITQRGFKVIHYLSFMLFVFALLHGLWSGTDATSSLATAFYWMCGGSTAFFIVYRVMSKGVVQHASA
jgi:predicted ferric reductase